MIKITLCNLFCVVSCVMNLILLSYAEESGNTPLLCRMTGSMSPDSASEGETVPVSNTRIVAVADIHGAYNELLRILDGAGIINATSSSSSCEWIAQPPGGTTLIQMGDVVDRGPGATEAWECLEHLQETSPTGSEVIRLVGNHELWWLEGRYHDRNKQFDTQQKCKSITQKLRDGIQHQNIVASYVRNIGGIPVVFVHAGYRKNMIEFMKRKYSIEPTAEALSSVTNKVLRDVIIEQAQSKRITLPRGVDDELFEAGKERGGHHIGGPFWTDFKALQDEFDPSSSLNMLQVVGHTAKRESFRGTSDLSAICIDAAMYTGTSTFLEIGYDLHFRLNVWKEDNRWAEQDVTGNMCST